MATIDHFNIERHTPRSWAEEFALVESLYSHFEQLGLASLAASRIHAYREIYADFRNAAKAGRRLSQAHAEAIFGTVVQVRELQRIVAAATSSQRVDVWVGHLRKLISGPPLLRPSDRHSPAWDYQFEAFLAAVAGLSGYSVQLTEPDVVVDTAQGPFAIAAKRPRSMGKLRQHLRDGATQVTKTPVPGIVALDLSFALYPGQCINTNAAEGGVAFVTAAANRALNRNALAVNAALKRSGILGILVQVHLPAIILGEPGVPPLVTCVRWTLAPSLGDERAAWVTAFARRCEHGLLGPLPSTPATPVP